MKLSKAILVLLIGDVFSSISVHDFWVVGKNTDKFMQISAMVIVFQHLKR